MRMQWEAWASSHDDMNQKQGVNSAKMLIAL